MTQNAKEKAKEIVEKYYIKRINFFYKDEQNRESIGSGTMIWYSAKQCAKIHVNGIIEVNPIIPLSYMLESEALDAAREFWNEVLKEIDKL